MKQNFLVSCLRRRANERIAEISELSSKVTDRFEILQNFRFHLHCGASTQSQCFVLFSFGSSGWYLQYQPNGRWNMSKMLYKISILSGCPTVYRAIHPLCRKVLKMRIWEIPPAGGPIL